MLWAAYARETSARVPMSSNAHDFRGRTLEPAARQLDKTLRGVADIATAIEADAHPNGDDYLIAGEYMDALKTALAEWREATNDYQRAVTEYARLPPAPAGPG